MRSIRPSAPDARYSPLAIFLHWTMAALILGAWMLPHLRAFLPHDAGAAVIGLHRSFGESVLLLLLLRILWRFVSPPPGLPGGTAQLVRWASHAAHAGLYLLMLSVPLLGILMTWAGGHALGVFGLAEIPAPAWLESGGLRGTFRGLHELAGNAILLLAGLHALAALVHHYVFKDGLIDRMLPRPLTAPRGRDALI